jgi:beta-lactamase regulating signal transducer with metallopeptidase domain
METENIQAKVDVPVAAQAATPATTPVAVTEANTQSTVLWVLGSVFALIVLVGAGMWLYQRDGQSGKATVVKEVMVDVAAKKSEVVPAAKEVLTPTAAAAADAEVKTPNTAGRKAADDFAASFETNHSGDATLMDGEKDSEASDVDSLGNNNSLHSAYDEASL